MALKTYFFMVLVVLMMAVGCKSPKVITHTETVIKDTTIVREIPREIIVTEPADTSIVITKIECDSVTNKPVPVHRSSRSDRAGIEISLDSTGVLEGIATCDSLNKVIEAKDREITTLRDTKSTIREIEIIYKTAWYDKASRVLAIIAIAYIGLKLYFKIPLI